MSGDFTRIGFLFFEWKPIRHLDPTALKVWLTLYIRSIIPGLWIGDLPDLASQSFLSMEDSLRGLDQLLERDLIEFDRDHRVLRLTQLPDVGEWPSAPSILRSWWKTFNKKITACPVRDEHVTTLRWLMEEGAKHSENNKSKVPSQAHEEIWAETFATVRTPLSQRRGVRSFGEADMGSEIQPSLFSKASVSEPTFDVGGTPGGTPAPDPINSNRSGSEGYHLSGTGVGEGAGEGVFSSLSPDPEEGGGSGEGVAGGMPRLHLVPMPAEPPPVAVEGVAMFNPETLVQTLRDGLGQPNGMKPTEAQGTQLLALCAELAADGIGEPDLLVLAEWLRLGGIRMTHARAGKYQLLAWWLEPGILKRTVLTARDWKTEAEERRRDLALAREQAGV